MRVFVSSVIKGFESYRAAARRGVLLVGMDPVMAEDFPALPVSPQSACLDGVRSSDVYLGVLTTRYGDVGDSGISPTEEEFEEATRLGLPRLILRVREELERRQAEFLERLAGRWGDGLLYGRFSSEDELKDEVVRAISSVARQGVSVTEAEAQTQLDELLAPIGRLRDDVVLGLGLVPSSSPQALIGLAELDAFASEVPSLLGRLYPQRGTCEVLGKERSVEVYSPSETEAGGLLFEVYDNGRVVCALGQTVRGRGLGDIASGFIIDEERVEADANEASRAFHRMLGALDQRRSITTVYIQGSLSGIRNKKVDVLPKGPVSSITIPSHDLPDPLRFPSAPLRLSVADLAGELVGQTSRATLRRIFAEATRPPGWG